MSWKTLAQRGEMLKVDALTTLFSEGRSHYCTSASNSSLELLHLVLSLREFRQQREPSSMYLDGCQQLGLLFFSGCFHSPCLGSSDGVSWFLVIGLKNIA